MERYLQLGDKICMLSRLFPPQISFHLLRRQMKTNFQTMHCVYTKEFIVDPRVNEEFENGVFKELLMTETKLEIKTLVFVPEVAHEKRNKDN
jgi:hypothetical protein